MATGKRGRHKASPEADGVSLSAVADHFDVNRKVVDRWMREGLPHSRKGGRIFVDVGRAAEWVAEHERDEAESLPRAKVYHSTDPRWRERNARGALIGVKAGLAAGRLINVVAAFKVQTDAIESLFTRLNSELQIHGRDQDALAEAVENMLADFTTDDPERWPVPSPFVAPDEPDVDPFATEYEFESAVEYVPILSDDDPRAVVAIAQAERYELELAGLQPHAVDLSAFLEWLAEDCARVRKLLRRVPGRIAKRTEPGDTWHFIDEVIQFECDRVRYDYCEASGFKPEWKPVAPKRSENEPAEDDDVDGVPVESESEFEDGYEDDDEYEYEDESAEA